MLNGNLSYNIHINVEHFTNFVQWLVDHPEFLKNELYVGGDSYSGIPVPMVVQEIYYGNFFSFERKTWKLLNFGSLTLSFGLLWIAGSPSLNLQVNDLYYRNSITISVSLAYSNKLIMKMWNVPLKFFGVLSLWPIA